MSNPSITLPSNPAIPTAAQLADTRLKQWHQQGEALITQENLRSWINATGLVLFAPRPQIVSPAPSLVEAVLGAPTPSPTLEQTSEARSLLARMVADGLAVPLNLLGAGPGTVHAGAPGDTPDFVASTAVFSYIFTLRGDKAWKQPPATSGALKVSNLALAIHEALSQRGPLSAYDLTTEVGKEVTEAAVLRALAELWTHLRVLPLAQLDGRPTLWELTSARFAKQIKAGGNAGQPSALSALISLYLGQAVVASEDEVESFLSPLASRSRIRDVIHALLSARQLDTVAVEGRTMLHVTGALPAFLTLESAVVPPESQGVSESDVEVASIAADGAGDADGIAEVPRITKFVAKPRKIGTGYLAKAKPSKFGAKPGPFERGLKPSSRPAFKDRPTGGFKSGVNSGPASGRERRPFSKPASGGFDKPWDEEKTRRLAAARKPSEVRDDASDVAAPQMGEAAESTRPFTKRTYKPRTEGGDRKFGSKPAFRGKPSFGDKPAYGGKPAFRSKPSFGDKPAYGAKPRFGSDARPPRREFAPRGEGGDARPPRRDFAPRTEGSSSDARPPRKTFSKPGTFGRKREGFAARPSGDARPPRREFTPRPQGDRPPRADGGSFAPRKPYAPRGAGFFSAKPRPSDDRAERSASGPRSGQDRGTSPESGKRVYRKFDAPRDRPARPYSADRPARADDSGGTRKPSGDFAPRKFGKPAGKSGGFAKKPGGKPGGGFGGKKSFSKPGAAFPGKSTSTFAKFAENKKPFGKRAPARKYKPTQGESS